MRSKLLAIDIGGGTQDILLYDPEDCLENAVKLVLPSPTVIAARRIRKITQAQKPLFLSGRVMGGGAVSKAVKRHLSAGLQVFCLPEPALTLHDDLEKVQGMGVRIVERRPDEESFEVSLGDIQLDELRSALACFEVSLPDRIALAIQDHGFSPKTSNRLIRFKQWQRFLDAGGDIRDLLHRTPPPELTRWIAAAAAAPHAWFMDTSAAALRGALLDDFASTNLGRGLIVINAGNEHTVAFLVNEHHGKIRAWGVYEHHTGLLTPETLADHVKRFAAGRLTHREIFDEWGHGVGYHPDYEDQTPFQTVVVTGPRRSLAGSLGHLAAPFGEMMLSGCFGLVEALKSCLAEDPDSP